MTFVRQTEASKRIFRKSSGHIELVRLDSLIALQDYAAVANRLPWLARRSAA